MEGAVRVFLLRLIAAAACIAIGTPLVAQTLRSRERTFEASETLAADLRRARVRRGPFYLLSYLQFSDLGYDSQFFFPAAQQAGGVSLAIQAPQKLYFVPARKTVYSLTFTPEYDLFANRSSNSWGYLVRGDAHFLLNHIYINPYAQQSDRLQVLIGEINRIVTQREKAAGLGGEFRYSSRTRLFYSGSARSFTFPASRYQPNDVANLFQLAHDERNARLMLLHHTFPLTSLTLASEWSKYTFGNAAFKDSTRRYVAPGFSYDSGRASLKAEAGPAVLHFAAAQSDFRGVLGNAAYTRRIGTKTNLSLGAERDVDFSIAAGSNYYVADRALFAIDRPATRRLTLRFSSTVGRDNYPVATINPLNATLMRRDDEFMFTAVGWRYALRHATGGFDVGYYYRQSNFGIDEQSGIRIAVQLSLHP